MGTDIFYVAKSGDFMWLSGCMWLSGFMWQKVGKVGKSGEKLEKWQSGGKW